MSDLSTDQTTKESDDELQTSVSSADDSCVLEFCVCPAHTAPSHTARRRGRASRSISPRARASAPHNDAGDAPSAGDAAVLVRANVAQRDVQHAKARRGHTQPHQSTGQPQPGTNQPQPEDSQHAASKQTDPRQQVKSHSTGSDQEPSNPASSKKAHRRRKRPENDSTILIDRCGRLICARRLVRINAHWRRTKQPLGSSGRSTRDSKRRTPTTGDIACGRWSTSRRRFATWEPRLP